MDPPPPWFSSATLAFRGLTSSEKVSFLLHLINELSPGERLQWQEASNAHLHRDFVRFLPPELSDRILHSLDAESLLNCCQVSRPWNARIGADGALWARAAEEAGATTNVDDMKRSVARCLRQRRLLSSGAAFKQTAILEEEPRGFVATDFSVDSGLLAAVNVYDVRLGDGVVVLRDVASGTELCRLRQPPEFGFPCAVKLLCDSRRSGFMCVAYVSGKVSCYSLNSGNLAATAAPALMSPVVAGTIYCIGGCRKSELLVCGGSDCAAYVWHLRSLSCVAVLRMPAEEAVISVKVYNGMLLVMTKIYVRLFKFSTVRDLSKADVNTPWAKIPTRSEDDATGFDPAANAFFTPGVHYHLGGGSSTDTRVVTLVRQKPLFETETIGYADIVSMDSRTGRVVDSTHVNQKIRKLLAVGKRYALLLLPYFDSRHKNLVVVDLVKKRSVGGCTVPHSKTTTPDLSHLSLGDVSWLDGLGGDDNDCKDSTAAKTFLLSLPITQMHKSHVVQINLFQS